jgi:hypothetical protein
MSAIMYTQHLGYGANIGSSPPLLFWDPAVRFPHILAIFLYSIHLYFCSWKSRTQESPSYPSFFSLSLHPHGLFGFHFLAVSFSFSALGDGTYISQLAPLQHVPFSSPRLPSYFFFLLVHSKRRRTRFSDGNQNLRSLCADAGDRTTWFRMAGCECGFSESIVDIP